MAPSSREAASGDADREPGILGACQDLHMLATVSADGMPDSDSLRLEVYLQRRLDGWAKHAPITALHGIYDETIRMLVTVTLAEWRACPWHPRASRAIPAALGENRP